MAPSSYFLGMPFWGHDEWAGSLYTRDVRPAERLSQYASVFNSVEGNTTFYQTPRPEIVARWREETPEGFRFFFKLPREITHDAGLVDVGSQCRAFLERMEPLRDRLGPFLIQLPATFAPEQLSHLTRLLGQLSREFSFAVELRHPAFFDGADWQERSNDVLRRHHCDRVIMDTRPLRDPLHDAAFSRDLAELMREVRHKKPDLPVIEEAIGARPVVRLICHPDEAVTGPWLDRWADVLCRWIGSGLSPYVFVHSPSNRESPVLARQLHERLSQRTEAGKLAPFPGESGELSSGQLRLL
jgi:uncharacterized protein YecE (DUF72 family)